MPFSPSLPLAASLRPRRIRSRELLREHDPWGNPLQGSATSGYAFTGREWDSESSLYYYRARYYDPKIGRFISEDPIGRLGGSNYYAYGANRPTRSGDPLGLKPGDRFKDADTAVLDVFKWLLSKKRELAFSWEWGGRVCCKKGEYFCTEPRTSNSRSYVDPGTCTSGENAGTYHSHTKEDDSVSNDFNPFDESLADSEGKPWYLLNPLLEVRKYVTPGPSRIIGRIPKPR